MQPFSPETKRLFWIIPVEFSITLFMQQKHSPPFSIIAKKTAKKRTTSFLSNMNRRGKKKRSKLSDHAQLPLTFCFCQTNDLHSWIRVFWFPGSEVWRKNNPKLFRGGFFFGGGVVLIPLPLNWWQPLNDFFLLMVSVARNGAQLTKTCQISYMFGLLWEKFLNLVLELSGSPPAWVNQMDGKSQPSTASDPHHQQRHGTLDVAVAQKKQGILHPDFSTFQPLHGQAPMFVT